MSYYPPLSPTGLASSPRANRQMQLLSPLDTSFPSTGPQTSPYSSTSEKQSAKPIDIFADATIPLSPASSTSSSTIKVNPYEGLVPRKRSGLARLFCCLGRQERARRRVKQSLEFEKVGESCHWTEY